MTTTPIDAIQMPPLPVVAIRAALDEGPTPGPWSVPHYCQEGVGCNCTSVLCESYFGAIATIHFNDGVQVSEGGGDDPVPSEAKANGMLIAACNPENIRAVLDYVQALEARLAVADARVAQLRDALEELMEWQVKKVHVWHNSAYDNAANALLKTKEHQ